jgi:hypothetical protein
VNDLTQLQKRKSSTREADTRGKGVEGQVNSDGLESTDDAEFGTCLDPELQGEEGPQSFMYYTTTTGHFMDDMLKEWLDESMFSFGS